MKISILGHGVVGKGVYEMLQACPQHTVLNVLVKKGEADPEKKWMVESIDYVLKDSSELVIECMGGIEPAFEFASKCLDAGKSFITSNKALVAAHGIELMQKANSKGLSFLFSAACGGAIPILQNIYNARQADSILYAGGILNGTTNYMLDAMDRRSLSFEGALAEAKALGYAEADPTADLSGLDTLRKIMLISMVAYDTLPTEGCDIEGIQNVSAYDFEMAKKLGCTIKLMGKSGLDKEGRLFAYVEPVLCGSSSSFSVVRTNTNLAFYDGKNSGYMSFGGQGAGRYPTASAVLRDVYSVECGQKQMLSSSCKVGQAFNDSEECENHYLIRSDCALDSYLPVEEVLGKQEDFSYVITKKIGVKKMHEVASGLREKGVKLFFAQCEGKDL